MRIHVLSSRDGINYDTVDFATLDIPLTPGKRVSKTTELSAKVMFIKIIVENMDRAHDVTDVNVTATLGQD